MPINIENPLAFSFIMQDDIFLLSEDRNSFNLPAPVPSESQQEPQIVAAPKSEQAAEIIAAPEPVKFACFGGNKKNFLVIVHYPGQELMDDGHFAALESTLGRLGFTREDVAILNLAKYPGAAMRVLENQFKPVKLLLMGAASLPVGLPAPNLNKIEKNESYVILHTFSFGEMMESNENKKMFWEQMKQL